MRYVSTRNRQVSATLSDAIQRGLAPDGGLFVPARFPTVYLSDFAEAESLSEVGVALLSPFFIDDRLAPALESICARALDGTAPLEQVTEGTSVLELFHGPTACFEDFGALFLAEALSRLGAGGDRRVTLLLPTTGDAGAAAAAAIHGRSGMRAVILFPDGAVSSRQAMQLTGQSDAVVPVAVRGDFHDCQRLANEALADEGLAAEAGFALAGCANIAHLLPQMAYFADASIRYLRSEGVAPGFIVPAGNLGNAVACLWAQRCGAPIREMVLSTNANDTLSRFMATGEWSPDEATRTLAPAMDVADPINIGRLTHLFGGWAQLHRRIRAFCISDEEIEEQIRRGPERWGRVWDPHTATAVAVRERMESPDWILVATAHPAKFHETVEPLIGRALDPPPSLAELAAATQPAPSIVPELEALRQLLRRGSPA
jgi:threonine synthase